MGNKKTTFVLFGYSDGSFEYASDGHAEEVMEWLNSCQTMKYIHGGQFKGRKMIEVYVSPENHDLESIKAIAEREFSQEAKEINERRVQGEVLGQREDAAQREQEG